MKHEQEPRAQVTELLGRNKLAMAARLCRRSGLDIKSFGGLQPAIEALYKDGRYQEILGAYREVGVVGQHTSGHLLRRLAHSGNDPAFLKHAAATPDSTLKAEVLAALRRRIDQLLKKGALVKAARACRKQGIRPDSIKEVNLAVEDLYKKGQYQVILGAFYEAGVFGPHTVRDLIGKLSNGGMPSAFLVNAYRFGLNNGFETEIARAIQWHRDRGLKDADAWERKFAHLEQLLPPAPPVETQESARVVRLRPVIRAPATARSPQSTDESDAFADPYIVSKISRVKVEQATAEHVRTLGALEEHLTAKGFRLSNSNLIDLLGQVGDWTGIFEIKSINAENERDQVRHAVSQLFEYRFLHKLPTAELYVVFSAEPFSGWLVDYLRDLELRVLWIDGMELTGPDLPRLLRASSHRGSST